MKKNTNWIVISIFILLIFSTESYAQSGNFNIGGGLLYGSGAIENLESEDLQNDFGVQLNAFYNITDEIRFGGNIFYYFPKNVNIDDDISDIEDTFTLSGLNIEGQYLFINDTSMNVYGLLGLTFTNLKKKREYESSGGQGELEESESKSSINVGAGVEFKQEFGNIFIELKYNLQATLGAGIRFRL